MILSHAFLMQDLGGTAFSGSLAKSLWHRLKVVGTLYHPSLGRSDLPVANSLFALKFTHHGQLRIDNHGNHFIT